MRKRGFSSDALRAFWIELGLNQKDISVSMKSIESHNSKVIERETPRASFVREKHNSLILNMGINWPSEELQIPKHPDNPNMGFRVWPAPKDGDTVILENEDVKELIRLKEFANVYFDNGILETNEFDRTDRRPIVHWLLKHHCKPATLSIPEGENLTIQNGLIESGEYSVGDILQLERVGFARITEIPNELEMKLVYLHE